MCVCVGVWVCVCVGGWVVGLKQRAARKIRELSERRDILDLPAASAVAVTAHPSATTVIGSTAPITAAEKRLQQKITELEERLNKMDAARASGLDDLRLTLQHHDSRTALVSPLTPPLPGPSQAAAPEQALWARAGAVAGVWWGKGVESMLGVFSGSNSKKD